MRKTGETPCGREGRSSLGRVSKGQALRTGHRSARGVAQDAPFFTAARLERRAGALTGAVTRYEGALVREISLGATCYPLRLSLPHVSRCRP